MKKVIFKGVINGKEFDNVKDYNDEMTKLLGKGGTISASSSTEIVDDKIADDTPADTPILGTKKDFSIDDFLPFFSEKDIDTLQDGGYYLEKLIYGDEKLDNEALAATKKRNKEAFDNLIKTINENGLSVEDAFGLISRIKEIRDQIESDGRESVAAISSLEDNIRDTEKKIQVMKSALNIIDVFKKYYNDAFIAVKEYLLKN